MYRWLEISITVHSPCIIGNQCGTSARARTSRLHIWMALPTLFSAVTPSVERTRLRWRHFWERPRKDGPGFKLVSHFQSFLIDPTNTGPEIALNALIGAFVDSSGLVLQAFAPGLGPFSLVAPSGATQLLLGVNDDLFGDNSGALRIDVTVGSVPEPETYALLLGGLSGLLGFAETAQTSRMIIFQLRSQPRFRRELLGAPLVISVFCAVRSAPRRELVRFAGAPPTVTSIRSAPELSSKMGR